MSLLANKNTRALIVIMCALVLSAITISHFYFKSVNASTDPRIAEARTLYGKYNNYAENNEFNAVFSLMDSIESIYSSIEHYKSSYEVGVLYNNRAASFLTIALFSNESETFIQDSLINLAEQASSTSIDIYTNWLSTYQELSKDAIKKSITTNFFIGLESYDDEEKSKFLIKRIEEIKEAQLETPRRLSVAYTNLGVIYRHRLQYETAVRYYQKAIDLWDRNLTAENNLNKLLGRPEKKRNLIQKLFPPERVQN